MDLGADLTAVTFWGFILTSALIEITPGPNMIYLAVVSVGDGRRAGYAAVAGVALGLAVVGLIAALGLAAAISASPALYQALRWGGVFYLLWLAWDGWQDAGQPPDMQAGGVSGATYFRRGLITNLLNPKAAVFYVAVLPGFVQGGGSVLGQTIALSLSYVAVATLIHTGIVTLAGSARRWLADERRSRTARRALSILLAGVAVWFAWKTRS